MSHASHTGSLNPFGFSSQRSLSQAPRRTKALVIAISIALVAGLMTAMTLYNAPEAQAAPVNDAFKTANFKSADKGSPGSVALWTVPAGVEEIVVFGRGGSGQPGGWTESFGVQPAAFQQGNFIRINKLKVIPGETLEIRAGGTAADPSMGIIDVTGGWNGGGNGSEGTGGFGGAGGGATDIRRCASPTAGTGNCTLAQRIAVIGGVGGGVQGPTSMQNYAGGQTIDLNQPAADGMPLTAQAGKGGKQDGGGAAGVAQTGEWGSYECKEQNTPPAAGAVGQGGNAGTSTVAYGMDPQNRTDYTFGSAGGGGGYYGGGAGGGGGFLCGGAAGGGSTWADSDGVTNQLIQTIPESALPSTWQQARSANELNDDGSLQIGYVVAPDLSLSVQAEPYNPQYKAPFNREGIGARLSRIYWKNQAPAVPGEPSWQDAWTEAQVQVKVDGTWTALTPTPGGACQLQGNAMQLRSCLVGTAGGNALANGTYEYRGRFAVVTDSIEGFQWSAWSEPVSVEIENPFPQITDATISEDFGFVPGDTTRTPKQVQVTWTSPAGSAGDPTLSGASRTAPLASFKVWATPDGGTPVEITTNCREYTPHNQYFGSLAGWLRDGGTGDSGNLVSKCTYDGMGPLLAGTNYTFTVTGVYGTYDAWFPADGYDSVLLTSVQDGTSAATPTSDYGTPIDLPVKPATPTVETGPGGGGTAGVTVKWTPNAIDAAKPVDFYEVLLFDSGGNMVTYTTGTCSNDSHKFPQPEAPLPSELSCTINGLTDGANYTARVTAFNLLNTGLTGFDLLPQTSDESDPGAAGSSGATPDIEATTRAVGDGKLNVNWNDAGESFTNYKVYVSTNGTDYAEIEAGPCYSSTVGTSVTCEYSGVAGTSYQFKVAGSTDNGSTWTDLSDASEPTVAWGAPATPTGLAAATATSAGAIDLTWTDNGDSDSNPTQTYEVRYTVDGGDNWTTVSSGTCSGSTGTPCQVTGLPAGADYQFQIRAVNDVGASEWSSSTSKTAAISAPAKPSTPTAAVATGQAQVNVTWAPAVSTDTAPVTGQTLQICEFDSVNDTCPWTDVDTEIDATTGTYSVADLTAGTTYKFRVAAKNNVDATWSDVSEPVTAIDPPDAPEWNPDAEGAVTQGNKSLTVKWNLNEQDVAKPTTGYRLMASTDGGATFNAVDIAGCANPMPNTQSECTLTGLTPGASYIFQIEAINAAGTASADSQTDAVVVVEGPEAPTVDSATPVSGQVGQIKIDWTKPAAGTTPDSYEVFRSTSADGPFELVEDDGCAAPVAPDQNDNGSCVDTGEPGTQYWYKVAGKSGSLVGDQSAAFGPVTALQAPASPTDVEVSVTGPQKVTVGWNQPDVDGGDPDQWEVEFWDPDGNNLLAGPYLVSAKPTEIDLSQPAPGIDPGTAVIAKVRAKNAVGTSDLSDGSDEIVVIDEPQEPSLTAQVEPGVGKAKLNLAILTSISQPVSSVKIQIKQGDNWVDLPESDQGSGPWGCGSLSDQSTECTVEGMTPGTAYEYRVVTSNEAGESASDPASVTAIEPPNAATSVGAEVVEGNGVVEVSWTDPEVTDAKPVTNVKVQYAVDPFGDGDWVDVTAGTCKPGAGDDAGAPSANPCTVTGLTPGTNYKFRVVSTNDAGETSSDATDEVEVLTAPATPTDPQVEISGPGEISVDWTDPTPADPGADPEEWEIILETDQGVEIDYTTGTCATDPTAKPCTITGIDPGTMVVVKVKAKNNAGSSGTSTPSNPAVIVIGGPAVATNVAAAVTEGTAQMKVTWTKPASTDANPVDNQWVEACEWDEGQGECGPYIKVTGDLDPNDESVDVTSGLAAGKSYKFRVVTANSVGQSESDASGALEAQQPPASPGTPTVAPKGTGGVEVTWTAGSPVPAGGAVDEFEIWVQSPAGTGTWEKVPANKLSCGTNIESPCTIEGLTVGTEIKVKVTAKNAAGSTDSGESAGVTSVNAPVAPSGVGVSQTEGAAESLTVSWTDLPDGEADNYTVYISENENGPFDTAATCVTGGQSPNSSPCQINNLTAGTRYYVQVSASKSGVEGVNSDTESAVAISVPEQQPQPEVSLTGSLEFTVNWTPVTSVGKPVDSYEVQIEDPDNPGNWIPVTTGTCASSPGPNCTITAPDLVDGKDYKVRVIAKNTAGDSAASDASDSETAYAAPESPTDVTITNPTSGTAHMSWTPPTPSTGVTYKVYRSTSASGPWTEITCADDTQPVCDDSDLEDGKYYYKVESEKNGLTSPATDPESVTVYTTVGTPSITGLKPGNGKVEVTVAPGTGGTAKTYTVTAAPGGKKCTITAPATKCTITGLRNGTSYTFTATATNPLGTSESSATAGPVKPVSPASNKPAATFTNIGVKRNSVVVHWKPRPGEQVTKYEVRSRRYKGAKATPMSWSRWIRKGVTVGQRKITIPMPTGANGFKIEVRVYSGSQRIGTISTSIIRKVGKYRGKRLSTRGEVTYKCPPLAIRTIMYRSNNGVEFAYAKRRTSCARWMLDGGRKHTIKRGSRKFTTAPLRAGRNYTVGIITGKVLTSYKIYRSH